MSQDKIILKGMEFYGYHGALAEERTLGQKFEVDLELFLSLDEAGKTDNLETTVSYAEVFDLVRDVVTGNPYNLIEAVAQKITDVLFEHFNLKGVKVKVIKPQVPISGHLKYAAVEIYREPRA